MVQNFTAQETTIFILYNNFYFIQHYSVSNIVINLWHSHIEMVAVEKVWIRSGIQIDVTNSSGTESSDAILGKDALMIPLLVWAVQCN